MGSSAKESARGALALLVVLTLAACGKTKPLDASGSAGAGGSAGTTADAAVDTSGEAGGTAGAGGSVAAGGASGAAGVPALDCATVGCGAPPVCGQACGSVCGCCPCGEGTHQGDLLCQGGCWATADAGAGVGFVSFYVAWNDVFCAGGTPCQGSIHIYGDGQISRTGSDRPDASATTLSQPDLDAARAVFTASALVQALDSPQPDCAGVDGVESMQLIDGSGTHTKVTTFCEGDAIKAARDEASALAAKYLP